jgi:hypothetical protein
VVLKLSVSIFLSVIVIWTRRRLCLLQLQGHIFLKIVCTSVWIVILQWGVWEPMYFCEYELVIYVWSFWWENVERVQWCVNNRIIVTLLVAVQYKNSRHVASFCRLNVSQYWILINESYIISQDRFIKDYLFCILILSKFESFSKHGICIQTDEAFLILVITLLVSYILGQEMSEMLVIVFPFPI